MPKLSIVNKLQYKNFELRMILNNERIKYFNNLFILS